MHNFFSIIFIILIIATLFGLINFIIGKSAYRAVTYLFPKINRKIFILFYLFIALSFIISSLTRDVLPSNIRMIFNFIGSFYLAALYYLIIFIPLISITKFISKRIGLDKKRYISKVKLMYAEGVSVFLIVLIIIGYGNFHAANPKLTEYTVVTSKKSSMNNLKIAFVSDIHLGIGININKLNKMVEKIDALKADVIILGGDLVDENTPTEYFPLLSASLKNLSSTYGTFAIIGNHEFGAAKIDEIKKIYNDGNAKLLIDEGAYINDILLIGRNDDSSKSRGFEDRKPLHDILSAYKYANTTPLIVADHRPEDYDVSSSNGFDLQLSGHTHNGQFFPNVYLTHLQYKYSYGIHKARNMNLIVSSGYGTWGPPIRIGTDGEIVVINMEFNK